MKLKLDPIEVAQLAMAQAPETPTRHFDADEDFINYLHTFAHQLHQELQNTTDKSKQQYFRGMLYALKSVSQVYETLIKGDYI